MGNFKLYIWGGAVISALSFLIYHFILVNKLEVQVKNLENDIIMEKQRTLTCNQNLLKMEHILKKQNEKLEEINNSYITNYQRYLAWKNNKKESNNLDGIFNQKETSSIIEAIRNLDFQKDL